MSTKTRQGGYVTVEKNEYGETCYYDEQGELHREDGPALVPNSENLPSLWYWHGKEHREDGPARVYSDGGGFYYLWGQRYGEVSDYYLGMHEFCEPLPDETVAKAMKEHGFKTIPELGNWVMFEVLGEEAYEVLCEGNDNNLHYAMIEYLNNYEKYEGLPFSWWWPILSPDMNRDLLTNIST